jgi:hypothetical protein
MIAWLKKYYPYLGALFGVFMISYALIKTPTYSESSHRFTIMNNDLHELVVNGSRIISKRDANKYGVASINVDVAGILINDKDLMRLGWSPLLNHEHTFCKDGMIYAMSLSNRVYSGMKVINMNFRYSSKTIDICSKQSGHQR